MCFLPQIGAQAKDFPGLPRKMPVAGRNILEITGGFLPEACEERRANVMTLVPVFPLMHFFSVKLLPS
jgi:hypothetical protein